MERDEGTWGGARQTNDAWKANSAKRKEIERQAGRECDSSQLKVSTSRSLVLCALMWLKRHDGSPGLLTGTILDHTHTLTDCRAFLLAFLSLSLGFGGTCISGRLGMTV
jgi:hypothetical protein